MKKNIVINNKGFSLLEMAVVVIIITILASAAIPVLTRDYLIKAATKTALDISTIQEAARSYYINNDAWPGTAQGHTPMGDLTSGSYLPGSWNGINPFGVSSTTPSNYSYNISTGTATLTVSTYVPVSAQPIIQNLLPTNWTAGNNVYSTVTVPGGIIASLGLPIPMSAGTVYYANTDGFLVGNTYTVAQGNGFAVITDGNPAPSYVAQRAQVIWYSGGASTRLPISYPIKKGNYYEAIGYDFNGNVSNGQIQTLNFIPLNS
jgi:prepilin-type N-terminal cleavage/methylation domain-containing protein